MPLVDTHAHLDQEEFDADRADVIAYLNSLSDSPKPLTASQ